MKDGLRASVFVAALALAAAAAYWPAVHAGWVWDDVELVQPSPALRDVAGLRRAVATDLYRQASPRFEASPYWRPLALASYFMDTRLGPAPRALHTGNVLLHAIATALLALLLVRRVGQVPGAAGWVPPALATAWWAFHPEQVEAVAWISCRYDLLSAVAILGLLALRWQPGPRRAAFHGLLFLAGLLSKDGFGAMAIVVVADDWAERRAPAVAAPRWVVVGLAVAAWWGMRATLGLPSLGLPPLASLPRLLLEAIATYAARAVAPLPLTIGHPHLSGGAPGIVGGAAILLALAVAVAWRRRLAVPAALFVAGLVPAAVAMGKIGEVPERYFYVPSIGLALLLGELLAVCIASRRSLVRAPVPAAIGLVTLLGLSSVVARLPDWRSNAELFAAALRVDPEDAQANLQLGIAAGRIGDWNEARRAIEVAQRRDPRSGRIANALTWVLLERSEVADGLRQAQRATAIAPDQPDGWYYLAFARHLSGDHSGELSALERALRLSPGFPPAREARAVAACEVSSRTDCGGAASPKVAPR